MGKKKKKFKKKVNPEKSNKMIIAVAIGVVIVMALFFLLMITSSGGGKAPVDKGELMKRTLKYLDTAEGISQLKYYPDQDKVVIIYESYKEDKQDFQKIARYAGLKLSHKMGDEELTLVLAKDKEEQAVRSYTIKGGRILTEKIF
ncbi:MAG: hypothetical protein JSV88_25720 [Candidatus Aminicenantes bacterium]|nr:MAG: hypothetical protein JSV88_25720 [Candidatus Aminicenantes bacterium]